MSYVFKKAAHDLATNMFRVWDTKRLGHFSIDLLADKFVGLGLSQNKDQVLKMIKLVEGKGSR